MRPRPTVDYTLGLKHCSKCDQWLPFEDFRPAIHKNGGCGLRSSCKNCDRIIQRLAYKPRENPKLQRKQHIFDIRTRLELRQCSHCMNWHPLVDFFMHGRLRSNLCKPCERAQSRERASKDVAKHIANANRWKAANPEKIRARRPGYNRKYAAANLDKLAEKQARRRARLMGAVVEPIDRNAIIKRDGRVCYLCGLKLKWREVTIDHVIPLARGGSHTAANLKVACGPCNFSKQDRLLGQLALAL